MARQRRAYPTDWAAEAWQILTPLLPPEQPGGRPRTYPRRAVLNGLPYGRRGGGAWRLMPPDLPPWQTASQTFRAWRQAGTWPRSHAQLRDRVRTAMGRPPHPPAALIEAHTVKPTAKGGATAMTAPRHSAAARALASWRRRVSCGVSSSTPPI